MSALPHAGPAGSDPELDRGCRRRAGRPCFRDSLRAFAETLRLRFEGGEDVERLVTRRAGFVDDLLRRAWRVAMRALRRPPWWPWAGTAGASSTPHPTST